MRHHLTRQAGRAALALALLATTSLAPAASRAGTIFVTGHDPDYHATIGYHAAGASRILQVAIEYILHAGYNPYAGHTPVRFLYVESRIPVPDPPLHSRGRDGLVNSGYIEGPDFEWHDASDLAGELAQLGSKYAGLVVASDYGATLTQAELDVLNDNAETIANFVNSGGGIFAMAESNLGAGLTPNGGHYKFLPSLVTTVPGTEFEIDYTLSSFGESLGLVRDDINDNVRHCIFSPVAMLMPDLMSVDFDTHGNTITLAGRTFITAVEPATWGSIKQLYR